MGANLYGLANTPPALQGVGAIGNVNINCPAGVETNIIQTGTIASSDRGFYYICAWMTACLTIGVTAPSQVVFGLRVNNGADLALFQANQTLVVASTSPEFSWNAVGYPPQGSFYPPGSVIQLSVNPTGQAVTCTAYCTQAIIGIFRQPP